jgi:hypothetical protein
VLAYSGFLGMDPREVMGKLPPGPVPLHLPAATLTVVLVLLIVVGLTLL